MSSTILVDGSAVAYIVNVDKYNNQKDYARAYFDKLRDYAREFATMPQMCLFLDQKEGLTWRDELFPDYQKGRKAQKAAYEGAEKVQMERRIAYINYIKKVIDQSGKFRYISYPHTESDDMIALYTRYIQAEGENVIIATTDNDLLQLIRSEGNRRVAVYSITKHKMFKNEQEGQEMLERKIMLGDPSDSIPSVCRGVGKTYFDDFKIFLEAMKEHETDPTDPVEAKKICESLGIKYIKSFSNYDKHQRWLNKRLVDLRYVCKQDKESGGEKTEYIRSILAQAKFSPFALYKLKIT